MYVITLVRKLWPNHAKEKQIGTAPNGANSEADGARTLPRNASHIEDKSLTVERTSRNLLLFTYGNKTYNKDNISVFSDMFLILLASFVAYIYQHEKTAYHIKTWPGKGRAID